ncbi:MAG: single-stranded DNA-binding protein [Neisseria sp.]|nr:single-stranded DNA-binding protein [Neisseria sp.]
MSLNKVILIGNLGRDPEVRYMPNGDPVCNFSIATSESWNDRQTGQKVDRTEWHNITLYRRLAEVAGQYLRKGSQVYIEGKIQSRKYTGKDGIERTAYDIIGNEMKMLGGRQQSGGAPYEEGGYQAAPQQQYQPQSGYQSSGYQAQTAPAYNNEPPAAPRRQAPAAPVQPVEDIDDDIPF